MIDELSDHLLRQGGFLLLIISKETIMNWIKENIGLKWFIFICFICFFPAMDLGLKGFFAYFVFVFANICAIKIVEWVKPTAIFTDGGFFSLFWAKIFWKFGAHLIAIFICMNLVVGMFKLSPIEQARLNVETLCTEEQIAKTGAKGCENAKKSLVQELKTALQPIKKTYATNKNSITSLTKEKESKCSEQGIKDFGSQGCDNAKQNLDTAQNTVNNLDKLIKDIEQEITDLSKK